jgi:hypothetical protein
MIIAVGIFVFMAVCALSLVGLGESHSRVSSILSQMDSNREKEDSLSQAPAIEPHAPAIDVFAQVGFTRSLLALSKVRSLAPYSSQVPETVESSSLVSVRRVQS